MVGVAKFLGLVDSQSEQGDNFEEGSTTDDFISASETSETSSGWG